MTPWNDPLTVAAWRAFNAQFDRYHRVNGALAQRAELAGVQRVMDLGAGTGGTAQALLAHMPMQARLHCVEPAEAMREASDLVDARVSWHAERPPGRFDRVICGASIWLLGPLQQTLDELCRRLSPGGALLFAIPAAYLGEPDPPGGGPDPWLGELPTRLVRGRTRPPAPGLAFPDAAGVHAGLEGAGMRIQRWSLETRWTLASQAAWLALPPVGGAMRPDLDRAGLTRAVESALAECAPGSWRTERWCGWTAWR